MRTAGQIKSELVTLLYKKRLPKAKIAEDSRCSSYQIWSALKLEASETVRRRLDAYLDAPHLHKHEKNSVILRRIEDIREELWQMFQAKSLPMADIALWTRDRQQWLLKRMHWRAKRLLKEMIRSRYNEEVILSDGSTYWSCKKRLQEKGFSLDP